MANRLPNRIPNWYSNRRPNQFGFSSSVAGVQITHADITFNSTWAGASGSIFVDWDDGSALEEFVLAPGGVAVGHTYGGAGTYVMKITDSYGNVTSITANSSSISAAASFNLMPLLNTFLATSNSLTDISFLASNTSLATLFLNANGITDISPLANLTSLSNLRLNINSFSDCSPVAGLSALTSLRLDSNALTYTTTPWFTASSGTFRFASTVSTAGEVDLWLANLNTAVWANCEVYLDGTNPARTAASDADVAALVGRSVTLHLT